MLEDVVPITILRKRVSSYSPWNHTRTSTIILIQCVMMRTHSHCLWNLDWNWNRDQVRININMHRTGHVTEFPFLMKKNKDNRILKGFKRTQKLSSCL
jgi:hypothetical protein